MSSRDLQIVVDHLNRTASTRGARERVGYEIVVAMPDDLLLEGFEHLVDFILEYFEGAGTQARDGETIAFGTSTLKFVAQDGGCLELREYSPVSDKFVPGVNGALVVAASQLQFCDQYDSRFLPPRLDQLVSVSVGVAEGIPTEAVRYNMPPHHSGWILLTERYSGSVDTLRSEHLVHIVRSRPDLVRLLALAPGYRFYVSPTELDVEFDESVSEAMIDL